jgi:hypothetical protein
MSLHYGNWCGPNWSAGQKKEAKDLTPQDYDVPATNELDQICKNHDIDLLHARTRGDFKRANRKFQNDAAKLGMTGHVMSFLVGNYGPKSSSETPKEVIERLNNYFKVNDRQLPLPEKRSMETTPEERIVRQKNELTPYRDRDESRSPNIRPRRRRRVGRILSFNNLLPAPEGTMSSNGSKPSDGQETNVDKVGEQKLRPFHDTQDIVLPAWISVNAGVSSATQSYQTFSIRLNSPNDWLTVYTPPAPDADPSPQSFDAIVQTPMNWTYWGNIYNYWTCTACEYELKLYTNTPNVTGAVPNDEQELSVWLYHHGQQGPPLTDGTNKIPDYIRQQHKHAHMQRLQRKRPDEVSRDTTITFTGKWKPGNYYVQNLVAEDSQARTWNKFNALPPLHEMATLIIQHSDREYGTLDGWIVHGEFKVIYHVQCKDLKYKFEYPHQAVDFPAISDFYQLDKTFT